MASILLFLMYISRFNFLCPCVVIQYYPYFVIMKLFSKTHWSEFIYGLLYPGFIGSMIYELIPQTNAVSFFRYFTWATIIKILITIFYCVDYLHLYGDMNSRYEEEERSVIYFLSDVFSSLFFFLAFVMVKLGNYTSAVFFIASVPAFFLAYKWKNTSDRKFHLPYMLSSFSIFILYVIHEKMHLHWLLFSNPEYFLFTFILASLCVYTFYVFVYFEHTPRKGIGKK